jgi:hypothetical protein
MKQMVGRKNFSPTRTSHRATEPQREEDKDKMHSAKTLLVSPLSSLWLCGSVANPSTKLRTVDLMLLDLVAEDAVADAEQFGGLVTPAARGLQCGADQFLLVVFDG